MSVLERSPESPAVADLLERVRTYLPEDRIELIADAYEFAESSHDGQMRRTGDPYISHPLEVTKLVAGLELDQPSLIAALLHDVQEDCDVPNEEIAERFGEDAAQLVEGLTKLDSLPLRVTEEEGGGVQAQNLRKMLLAMAADVRVVLIKLCDRLHNMRTLYALSEEKQRRIARETMEIFAPLATRLGIWQIKWELEDLAFRYLEPERYQEIAARLDATRLARERYIEDVAAGLRVQLDDARIEAEVTGRAKHIYSIHQKARRYGREAKSFDQIYDLLALRILVKDVAGCYAALGVVHATWRPLPGQFDDYIASPKASMYQSLHTTVIGPGARPLEVQIRTYDMHRVAEYGVAAHWRYKGASDRSAQDEERIAWLRQLLEWQRELSGAEEFVESVKTDVFDDQVFVLSPKGDVLDLPTGATPLDFAYRIHTDLGHQTIGAKVNGKMTALNSPLQNGDVVEIMRSRSRSGPSRDWLSEHLGYLQTTTGRQKVRQWFRKQRRAESVERGREMLERELRRLAFDLADHQDEVLALFPGKTWNELMANIGYGDISVESVVRKASTLLQKHQEPDEIDEIPVGRPSRRGTGAGLRALGAGGLETTLARCCNPVPGDSVRGYVTRSRGVTVHRADCHNVLNERERDRLIDVDWGRTDEQRYPATVQIDAWDRVGLLRDISTVVAAEDVNMVNVNTTKNGNGTVSVLATLETSGLSQISRLLTRIETIRGVRSCARKSS